MVTSRSLDGLKLFPICKLLPGSMPVKYMGGKGKIGEWNISPGCKDNNPLSILGHSITTSLHQSNLMLVPI